MWHENMRTLRLTLLFTALLGAAASPRVAVIGGGVGAASASYFLRDLLQEDLEIDV
jgi:hypothetical protein